MITTQVMGYELSKVIMTLIIGFILGWVTRGWKEKYQSNIDNEKVITLMITISYIISVLASIANPAYQTPLALHGLMGTVLGFYFKNKPKI